MSKADLAYVIAVVAGYIAYRIASQWLGVRTTE